MLFSDDPRPNTYVTKTQAEAICKMAVDKASDTDGVVCQSITEHIANKYNLGGYKIAYGYTAFNNYRANINYANAGFTSQPIVVFSPLYIGTASTSRQTPLIDSVTSTSAVVSTVSTTPLTGVYWMAIGT